jgi:hypothetical protein
MKKEMNLKTKSTLFRLKSTMNKIQDSSYAYSKINKDYPTEMLDQETATQIIKIFEDIIFDLQGELKKYENTNHTNKVLE